MSFDTFALYGSNQMAQDYYDYLIAAKRVHDAILFKLTFDDLYGIDHVADRSYN